MASALSGISLPGIRLRQQRSGRAGNIPAVQSSAHAAARSMGIPALIPMGYTGPKYIASDWIERFFYNPKSVNQFGKDWDYAQATKIELADVQRRILNHTLTPKENGYMPYRTIIYSTIKKEGKTTLAGGVGAYWAAQVAPPDLVLCLANDQEQSAGRIFGAMTPTFYALEGPRHIPLAQSSKPEIRLSNGSIIQAIANNYAGNAGAEYGLTLWSELWAYTTERSRRLFEELIPINTKQKSIRWIETYVGFEDESDLLKDFFLRIFTDTDESGVQPKARPVPGMEDIQSDGRPACWHIPEEGLFYYHNHVPRMPWNVGDEGDRYRMEQKAELRHSQYVRLHENRWQASQGNLLLPEEYDDACVLSGPSEEPMFLAGDASQRNDTIALVGTTKYTMKLFGEVQERYKLVYCSIWDPKLHGMSKDEAQRRGMGWKKGDMDLDETIANEIKRLYKRGLIIGPFRYDPSQMHQVAVNLRKMGIPCVEFQQQTERLRADTFMANLMRRGMFDMYHHPILERHFKNAKAKEYENELIRIVKGTQKKANKVDGAVAAAMSIYAASEFRPQNVKRRSTSRRYMR